MSRSERFGLNLLKSGGKLLVFMLAFAIVSVMILPQVLMAQNEVSYDGSSTIGMTIMQAGAMKAFEDKTKIKIASFEMAGAEKGMESLIAGKITVAGIPRPLKDEEKKKGLVANVIGYDAIAVFVHINNPIKNITKEQLKGIFTGKIKNWNEIGGKDAPIKPNTEFLDGKRATTKLFQHLVMDDESFGKVKEFSFPRDQLVEVSTDENAICAVSIGLLSAVSSDVRNKVKAIPVNAVLPTKENVKADKYIISRPLILVTKGMPKGNVKEFIDFMLSKDGQEIVGRNFVTVGK